MIYMVVYSDGVVHQESFGNHDNDTSVILAWPINPEADDWQAIGLPVVMLDLLISAMDHHRYP